MTVLVIPAFPGMGKTYFKSQHPKYTKQILDSDSSLFSWEYLKDGRVRNPHFPDNYLNYIKYMYDDLKTKPELSIDGLDKLAKGVTGIIFTSTHEDVLKGLKEYGIPYISFIPKNILSVLSRYAIRGDSAEFMSLITKNYDSFIESVRENSDMCIETNRTITEYLGGL